MTSLLPLLILYLVILSTICKCEFTLGIRDSIMIAHSFQGDEFGPAQNMHGATYTVDVELSTPDIVEKSNWVIDIGAFSDILSAILNKYNFKNLNELFPSDNTTTEFMCRTIHNDLSKSLKLTGFCGSCRVKLFESHKAWAAYKGNIGEDEG